MVSHWADRGPCKGSLMLNCPKKYRHPFMVCRMPNSAFSCEVLQEPFRLLKIDLLFLKGCFGWSNLFPRLFQFLTYTSRILLKLIVFRSGFVRLGLCFLKLLLLTSIASTTDIGEPLGFLGDLLLCVADSCFCCFHVISNMALLGLSKIKEQRKIID